MSQSERLSAGIMKLDDRNQIAKIDKKNVYTSVGELPKQFRQAWGETQEIRFPEGYKKAKNIVLCGMGGSAYAAYFVKSLFGNSLSVPFDLVNGDTLPAYVNEDTLVMLSSYSGSTEEAISCANQALEKKAKITAVASIGSKLAKFTTDNNYPSYLFDPKFNPAGQPRLGQGYMIAGHMGILANIGFIDLPSNDVGDAIDSLEKSSGSIDQIAKETSKKFVEKIPVVVASEHLAGNAHTLRNQFNETAKTFSAYSLIPELNHHLMEGLLHPEESPLKFLFLRSSLYSPAIQKRFDLTKEVIGKNKIDTVEIDILGDTPLKQMLYALSFGGYMTFYLAIIYNQDPSVIPWVDYFKDKLSKG